MQCRVNLFCCCFVFDDINYGKAKIAWTKELGGQTILFLFSTGKS